MANKSHITIHQAYYGLVGHGHGLISSTLRDDELETFLSAFTDRPGPIPAGVALEAYLSGSPFGRYYVFTRTSPDPSAHRGGIVFTHVLIVEQDDIDNIVHLEQLFALFIKEIPSDRKNLSDLSIPIATLLQTSTHTNIPQYIHDVMGALGSATLPILFCGEINAFSKVIITIWAALPPRLRKIFSFSAGFSTQNVNDQRTIIYFQPGLKAQLAAYPFISDESPRVPATPNPISSFLLGGERTNSFGLFVDDLELEIENWQILSNAIKAYELYSALNENITADELRLLVRLTAKLSSDSHQGKQIKEVLIKRLAENISSGADSNLMALRNLTLSPFENAENVLSSAIKERIHLIISDGIDFDAKSIARLPEGIAIDNPLSWWQAVVIDALLSEGRSTSSDAIDRFWKILTEPGSDPSIWLQFIPNVSTYEPLYIKALPVIFDKDREDLIVSTLEPRKWFLLRAHLLQRSMPIEDAVLNQLQIEVSEIGTSLLGTIFLCQQLSDDQLLALALAEKNATFYRLYSERITDNPMLLQKIDLEMASWITIWSLSLEKTKNIRLGVANPREATYKILDLLIDGRDIPENVLSLMASDSLADVSQYHLRNQLWKKLPVRVKHLFVSATTNAIVKGLFEGSIDTFPEDVELKTFATSDVYVTQQLDTNRSDISKVVIFFESLQPLKDKFLADYLRYYRGKLLENDSKRLGRVIITRGFKLAANAVFDRAKSDNSFHSALAFCKSLVEPGTWDKIFYARLLGITPTEDSIYELFLSKAIALYPSGPEDRHIWQRAGGDESKLINQVTREENWRHAIRLLHNGGGGKKLSGLTLLREMLVDYPNNEQLNYLKNYIKPK